MQLSRFLSTTSFAGAALAGAPGCSDDSCGPGDAPDVGVVASGDAVTLTYGELTAGKNGDCPAADAPSGLVSLTLQGILTGGEGRFTLCVGRPDRWNHQSFALGLAPTSQVQLIDLGGTANGCTLVLDGSEPPGGTATANGLCGDGGDPAGFALVIDGTATLTRTCGSTVDRVGVTVRGRVAVAVNVAK